MKSYPHPGLAIVDNPNYLFFGVLTFASYSNIRARPFPYILRLPVRQAGLIVTSKFSRYTGRTDWGIIYHMERGNAQDH